MSLGALRQQRLRLPQGHAINVRQWGEAPVGWVLIHGFGDGGYVWNDFVARRPRGSAIVALDLCGHGDSDHDPAADYTVARHVADVVFIVRALQLERFVLMGHSLGAMIAMRVAGELPAQVTRLVLVDGGPALDPATQHHIHDEFMNQPWSYGSIEEYAARLAVKLPLASPRLLGDVASHALRSCAGRFELKCDRALGTGSGSLDETTLWSWLVAVCCPVLLVRGAASAALSAKNALRIVQRQPRCLLRTVRAAGHAVMLDNPAEFSVAVSGFIEQGARDSAIGTHAYRNRVR